ncbi:MAG: cupredoxin domain-containing protein [Candidatus Liptonbacteria bacterium]|nr:cupredoxin domain-containing protein [Candidatus Liptonbacteria bacterium]
MATVNQQGMPQTTLIKIVGAGAGVIVIAIALAIYGYSSRTGGPGAGGAPDGDRATVEGGTRGALPVGIIQVPEPRTDQSGKNVAQAQDLAIPVEAIETPGTENIFRHFEIRGEGNQYSPSKIVVREGDIVDIKFTAVDRVYNFFLPDFGVYATITQGQTKTIQFQASPYGTYAFSCKDVCNGFKMMGTLVVAKR